MNGGLDVSEPFFPQGFGAVPAVMRTQSHPKEMTQLTVKVGDFGLRPGQGADTQIAQPAQVSGQNTHGHAFPNPRLTQDQGKTTLAALVFNAPAEALDLRGIPQGLDRHLGRERIELEAVKMEQSFIHDGFWV